MKIHMFVLLLLASIACQAQTKLILHKSHSGSIHTFSKAYQHSMSGTNASNFGLPGNRDIVLVDSVIAVNDTLTLLKIRESIVCHPYMTDYKKLKASEFKSKTIRLVRHELLSQRRLVSYIKAQQLFYWPLRFNNPVEEIIFVGFE